MISPAGFMYILPFFSSRAFARHSWHHISISREMLNTFVTVSPSLQRHLSDRYCICALPSFCVAFEFSLDPLFFSFSFPVCHPKIPKLKKFFSVFLSILCVCAREIVTMRVYAGHGNSVYSVHLALLPLFRTMHDRHVSSQPKTFSCIFSFALTVTRF